MKIYKILIVSLSFLSILFSTNNVLAQQQRNVKSSCHVYTTAGLVGRGKCIIKTYVQDGYIMVEIQEPWYDSPNPGKPSLMRLVNKPSCTFWSSTREDGCTGEFWYGNEWGILVGAGEIEERGVKGFGYSLGRAYNFNYDGPLPRP